MNKFLHFLKAIFAVHTMQTMIRSSLIFLLIFGFSLHTSAQTNKKFFKGMYIQWGYNTEWYSKSNIFFEMANGDRFQLHKAKAKDRPDLQAILDVPGQISIPQYNYRIGFYLNEAKTKSLEINFDHIKYIVRDGQTVRVTGTIDGKPVDGDSILNPATFLHFEHTDGGNLLHINYAEQKTVVKTKKTGRPLINLIYKGGAGINIPRTDFTFRGDRLNNNFHVAGYNLSAEAGARLFFTKKLFLETTAKTGYVRYVNALANTTKTVGNRVHHGFVYAELIGTLGYSFGF